MSGSSLTDYSALLCRTVQAFSFPAVTFDFVNDRACRHSDMRGVEKHVRDLLCSGDSCAVRDGLSNVLYWGWAQAPGLRDFKVAAFRKKLQPGDHRLAGFSKLVKSMPESATDRLLALKCLKLPQFSQMSFTTKILMFLDPNSYPVLDLKLAKAYAQHGGFPPPAGLEVRHEHPHHGQERDLLRTVGVLVSEHRRPGQRIVRISAPRP